MDREHADTKADISAAVDRGESIGLMEPLLVGEDSRHRAKLTDLAVRNAKPKASRYEQ